MSRSPQPTDDGCSRREYLRRVGTGAATVGAIAAGGSQVAPRYSPVGRAQAIPPLVALGATAGVAAFRAGWMLRDSEVLGSDAPPEGLTPDALHNQVYETCRKRLSNDESMFIDQKNLIQTMDDAAYGEGKLAAIEALNDQQSQSEVQEAALNANAEYCTTVIRNFLRSWNESAKEFDTIQERIHEHPDLEIVEVFGTPYNDYADGSGCSGDKGGTTDDPEDFTLEEDMVELPNGEEFGVYRPNWEAGDSKGVGLSPVPEEAWHADYQTSASCFDYNENIEPYVLVKAPDDDGHNFRHLEMALYQEVYEELLQVYNDVSDGLITWVDGVYEDVQAGELDTGDLLTPRELAEMTADEEQVNQAIADLMALNVSVNLEREAEIYLPGSDATLYGSLAVSENMTLEAGQTIDPDEEDAGFYLTYDISQGEGQWTAYDDERGVDGGYVSFTEEPFEQVEYDIHTTAGEVATVSASDFEPDDADTPSEWEVDIGDQLDDKITDIERVNYYAASSETQYETIHLTEPFEIVTFTDSEGNEHESADFEPEQDPHDDQNYITEEEWEEMQDRYEEMIEEYEDSQESNWSLPGNPLEGIGDGVQYLGLGLIGLVVLGAVGFVTDLLPFLGGD
ncbi:hypothetical protein [Halopiger goleimassiliensis]|uniref:hypothetical protein n=1 Tax=Halopiger goleimassiliensis TaxID=1293048 RepID=UPI00067766BC|nr:hypothetical protein [Halopiger goleimassiliensis]